MLVPSNLLRRRTLSILSTILLGTQNGVLIQPEEASAAEMNPAAVVREMVRAVEQKNDMLDRTKTQWLERLRRASMGDEVAFYGVGGSEAPVFAQGEIDGSLATRLFPAADLAASSIAGPDAVATIDALRASCRASSSSAFAKSVSVAVAGEEKVLASALVDGKLGIGNRLRVSQDSFCSWKAYNAVLPKDASSRRTFRRELGRRLLPLFPGDQSAAEGGTAKRLVDLREGNSPSQGGGGDREVEFASGRDLRAVARRVEEVLDELVAKRYIARWQYTGDTPGEFPDDVDVELWAEGRSVSFQVLIDDEPTMQAAILLQEAGTRFYPQFLGSLLQAAMEVGDHPPWEPGPTVAPLVHSSTDKDKPERMRVEWEEYYVDPRRSADPDLFDPKQILMHWTLSQQQ